MTAKRYTVGIDVGGTFTDVLCYESGTAVLLSAKVPSIPGSQWRGVLQALQELGIAFADIVAFVHGTTIATNALLERKGAKTGMVTTEGFRDTIEVGRTQRLVGGLFDTKFQRTAPLADRDCRFEVPERVLADGSVERPLDGFDFAPIAKALRERGVETLAVCFLNAYRNDASEQQAGAALRALLPDVPVSESAAVVKERGEFERFSTAVLNAYLTPVLRGYLGTLTAELQANGVTAPVNIMGSNGGSMTLVKAADFVVGTFLSGPVGGVVGSLRVADMAGVRDCITFDMGGTSTDVALIHDLRPRISHANRIDAYPLQVPQLDIHTIGAGGGSIVWVQPDGTLEVGPRSAGAVPGPACYGRGGTEATISDANLLLGRLPTDRPLAGGLVLNRGLAEQAFRRVAAKIGTEDIVRLADGVLHVAVAKMAGAVREVSVHRGFDPRAFTLVGFGGAGPMHVLMVADELAIGRAIVPRYPGHLSALGQLLSDHRRDSVLAWGGKLGDLGLADFQAAMARMQAEATALLVADGDPPERQSHEFAADMRYAGQSFTLAVPWLPGYDGWEPLRRAFDTRHNETFGYVDRANDAEIVNLRLVSRGLIEKPRLDFTPEGKGEPLLERRRVWFAEGWTDCPIYDRGRLPVGFAFQGPAIVEEAGGTTIVPPGWHVTVHASGALDCRNG
jgi:N-methylhydantoinase A